jgi:hypothetical protein
MPRLSLNEIEDLALTALVRHGATEANARPVARSIRRAEADGLRSVGLGYLPTYLSHLPTGKVDGGRFRRLFRHDLGSLSSMPSTASRTPRSMPNCLSLSRRRAATVRRHSPSGDPIRSACSGTPWRTSPWQD